MQQFKRMGYSVALFTIALIGWVAAQAMVSPQSFDIRAGAAKTTLKKYANQAHVQLLFDYRAVQKLKTAAVKGHLTPTEALREMLSGSGLTFNVVNDHTIAVVAERTPTSSTGSQQQRTFTEEGDKSEPPEASKGQTSVGGSSPAQQTSTESPQVVLQQVTVTAERREESINKVPISMTALSQQTMDDLHIVNLSDIATLVPGVYQEPTPSALAQDGSSWSIRGILSASNAPTVQIYIDETPIAIRQMEGGGPSTSPQPLIFDLSRVEVLRGPQGTLFGASAMGGAIRFITPQPSLTEASGFAKTDVSYTQNGDPNYELGAAYGAPLVPDVAAFRVSAWFQSLGGFIDQENPATGAIIDRKINSSNSYVVRPAITWVPAEGLTITPALFMQHKYSANPADYWQTDLPVLESDTHVWGGYAQPLTDDLRVASLNVKYNMRGVTFESNTSYLDRSFSANNDQTYSTGLYFPPFTASIPGVDGVPANFHVWENDMAFTHAWQQEFRLSSQDPSSRIIWLVGLYYRSAVEGLEQLIPGNLSAYTEAVFGQTPLQAFGVPLYPYDGQQLGGYTNFVTTDISEAGFGDVTLNLTQALKADVGVRIDHTIVEGQNQVIAGPENGIAFSSVTLPDQVATPVTPRYSLTYQFNDSDMVYASASKGYRPGGGNSADADAPICKPSLEALGLSAAPATFGSDSLWNYEIGTKDALFDQHLLVQSSLYYIKWSNVQTAIQLPSCFETFTATRGNVTSEGFDLQLDALLSDNWKVGGLVGYTNAYYPAAEYGAPNNGAVTLLVAAGEKLAIRPWDAAVNSVYSHDIGSIWAGARGYLQADYRWLSANSEGAFGAPENPNVAGYDPTFAANYDREFATLNLRLGIRREGLDVSAYVNNATNSDPLTAFFYNSSVRTATVAVVPRTFGLTAWYRF